jgi:hypothetical protein
MATPVAWRFGPWATGQTTQQSPYQDVASTPISQTQPGPSAYEDIGGAGRGGPGITATAEYGPMTMSELGNMWGGAAARKGVGIGLGALMGQTPSINTALSMAPMGYVTLGSVLSSLFGGIRGTQDDFGIATPNDIQDMTDYGGQMKGQAMAAEAAAQRASVDSMQKEISGVNQPDWNGEDPEGTGSGGKGADDGGPGPGGGMGDAGGTEALGGVHRTRPGQSMTSTWGEAGDQETAIFIPDMMKRPGRQGNETDVVRALKRYLMALQQ